jgi:hypothetical protein
VAGKKEKLFMSSILNKISNPALVSRHDHLAIAEAVVVDGDVHVDGERVARGTLLGKIVATGKYRAYAEAVVSVAFANNSKDFTLDSASKAAKHLRVGDVIQGIDGTALGTIATYDPATGVGTLGANSTSNYAANGTNAVRIPLATLALAGSAGKLLQQELDMDGNDAVGVGYFEGFFVKSNTTLTATAMTAMGAIDVDTDEVRLK